MSTKEQIPINPYAIPSRAILWPSAGMALIGGANIIATKLFGVELSDSTVDVSRNFAIIGIIGGGLTISYNLGRRVVSKTLDFVADVYSAAHKNVNRHP